MYTFKILQMIALYSVIAYIVIKEIVEHKRSKQKDNIEKLNKLKLISQVMEWQEQTLPSAFRIELSRLEKMTDSQLKELLQ